MKCTLWSANKALKSDIATSDKCPYCGEKEMTEHMIHLCIWAMEKMQEAVTMYLFEMEKVGEGPLEGQNRDRIPILLTYKNIIYNELLPQVKRRNISATAHKGMLLLVA